MPSQFVAQTMPLGQLLANPHIIHTPPYQRSFAWEQEDAGRLFEDLVAALDGDGGRAELDDYFLGTMLFIEVERPTSRLAALPFARSTRVLEVVDGLQRLTTLTILLSLIRDLDVDRTGKRSDRLLAAIGTSQGAEMRPRLVLREPDEAFFHAHVRKPGTTRGAVSERDLSPAQENIRDVREHMAQALQDLDAAQRMRLVDFLLDKCRVVVVSTTGIDRAHRIFTVLNARGKPLDRDDILKADLLGAVPAASREEATAIWDAAKGRLEAHFEELFSYIRTIYGRSPAPVISSIRTIAAETGGAKGFIEQILQPAAAIYADILKARHSGSPQSERIRSFLTYLGWLKGQSDWVPPLLLWWLGRGKEPAELEWFLSALDRLACGLRILGYGAKRRASRFVAVVHAIRSGRDLKGVGSPLDLTRDELRTIHHNLRDLHARSAPMAKLVLLRINDHMAGHPQGVAHEDLSIEHVLPRKPGPNSPWRACFPDPGERDRHTESLGNLVLVSKTQNDRAGNLDFARKKDVLFKTADAIHLPVNAHVARQGEWTSKEIKEREAKLFQHLDQLWNIGPLPARYGQGAGTTEGRARRAQTADA